jgi:hypothetical protein
MERTFSCISDERAHYERTMLAKPRSLPNGAVALAIVSVPNQSKTRHKSISVTQQSRRKGNNNTKQNTA